LRREPLVAAVIALAVVLLLACPVSFALPRAGVLVPGQSLGGVSLGATERAVKRAWGPRFGVCRHCRYRTLYFTYVPFSPQGAAAVFRLGRAVGLFTLWSPTGWHTNRGLRIEDPVERARSLYRRLARAGCRGYYALTLRTGTTLTAFYVLDGKLWGFGLSRVGSPLCP
jgi:hypothetical protein